MEGVRELDFDSREQLEDALLRREWRTISWIMPHATKLAEDLQIEVDQNEEEEKNEGEDEDKVANMKNAANAKAKLEEKIEEWIS